MGDTLKGTFLTLLVVAVVIVQTFPLAQIALGDTRVAQYSGGIRVYGLVNTQLELSDADLLSLPTVSEIAVIKCVWGAPQDLYANWTGIPLFHILTLAGIKPEAVKVAFHSRPPDDFSSDLKVEDALNSSILLATKANGVPLAGLSEIAPGHIGGYRIVVPGRWGYKWVANVGSIEVVDYDYLGTYERPADQGGLGEPDEAIASNAYSTSIVPPLQAFGVPYGNRTFQVQAFTNALASDFSFNLTQKAVDISFDVSSGIAGFADIIIQQAMITGPYETFLDGLQVSTVDANATGLQFQYVTLPQGKHSLKLVGAEFLGDIPTIVLEPLIRPAYVGRELVFNATNSMDDGTIVTFDWGFGDGTNGTGAVVSHSYNNTGTFQVVITVVDNFDRTSSKTFEVTIQQQPLDILSMIGMGFAVATVIAFLLFGLLLLRRRKKNKEGNLSAEQ